MKLFLVVVSLVIFPQMTNAQVTSSDIAKYLPGKWCAKVKISQQLVMNSETVYFKNGKVTYNIRMTSVNGGGNDKSIPKKVNGAGKWKVEGRQLIITVTKTSSQEIFKVGQVMKDRVTHIDSNKFSYVDDEGTAMTEYRICNSPGNASRKTSP